MMRLMLQLARQRRYCRLSAQSVPSKPRKLPKLRKALQLVGYDFNRCIFVLFSNFDRVNESSRIFIDQATWQLCASLRVHHLVSQSYFLFPILFYKTNVNPPTQRRCSVFLEQGNSEASVRIVQRCDAAPSTLLQFAVTVVGQLGTHSHARTPHP